MDLKSLITVAAVATAGVALAAYESPVKLCQIKLDTTTTNTIIALPLVNVGSTTVNPTNYVLTAGLSEGDILYASYGKDKAGWRIDNSGQWSATPIVVNDQPSAPSDTLPRGTGVWLKRLNPTAANAIYLYGQIATDAVTSTAAPNAFTMMGNPKTSSVTLQNLTWTVSPSEGDEIEMLTDGNAFGAVSYTWMKPTTNAEKATWCLKTLNKKTWDIEVATAPEISLKPGQGFWYRNISSSNTPTINWGDGE